MTLTLELARATHAGRPFDFVFEPQRYMLRSAGGGFQDSTLPWGDALLADLTEVHRPGRDPIVVQRLGTRLREFLAPTRWPVMEAEIREAVSEARPVFVTIRSGAAELYALPWELLTIESTGQHIGELPGVLVRYEWPETESAPRQATHAAPALRILLAWSGHVPAAEHEAAIRDACQASSRTGAVTLEVLPDASCTRLAEWLGAAAAEGRPIGILHLLCHGTSAGSTFGLALDGDEPGAGVVAVDPGRLRMILGGHAETLRLVVLAACGSGDPAVAGNQIGSVAQALHCAGLAAVVASRYPLSTSGSNRLARMLYRTLFAGPGTLEAAFLAARHHLAEDARQLDWASLQLYARAGDGHATRPLDVAALDDDTVREELSQFRALFRGSREQIALLGRYKVLHDVLQDLESPFNAIARDYKRLSAAPDAWDELRDPLDNLQMFVDRAIEIMSGERLRDEFDGSRRRLGDARTALAAALTGENRRLDGAILHIRRVLALDLSSANHRLLTTARELRLDAVIAALRAVVTNLGRRRGGPGSPAPADELGRLVASLDQLRAGLDALVREHDHWQAIDNDLRHVVGGGADAIEELTLSWPVLRASLDDVQAAAGGADWVHPVAAAAAELDAVLGQGDARRSTTCLRSLARRCGQRFVDVDKQLLATCGDLRRVGDSLDSMLTVIDES